MGAGPSSAPKIREWGSDSISCNWSLTPIHSNKHYLFANRSKYAFRNLATFGAITIWQYG